MKVKNTPDGIVTYNPASYQTIRLNKAESRKIGVKAFPKDTPPEIVHLEISDRCNLSCPYCYVKNKAGNELSTENWKKIIKDLAGSGVFQITFGGGEPTLREDLGKLARYAKKLGLTLCMTSNGVELQKVKPDVLRLFDQVNISWHDQADFNNALFRLQELKVRRGINYCLSKDYAKDINTIIDLAQTRQAEILFLTYKPVNGDVENQIPPEKVFKIAKQLSDKGIPVAIDGLTCNICLASKRFCDVNSQGEVSICSFIRQPIGNLLEQPFLDIWHNRPRVITCPYKKAR